MGTSADSQSCRSEEEDHSIGLTEHRKYQGKKTGEGGLGQRRSGQSAECILWTPAGYYRLRLALSFHFLTVRFTTSTTQR